MQKLFYFVKVDVNLLGIADAREILYNKHVKFFKLGLFEIIIKHFQVKVKPMIKKTREN